MVRLSSIMFVAFLWACGGSGKDDADDLGGDGFGDADTGGSDADTSEDQLPADWLLSLSMDVGEGAPTAGGVSATVTLRDGDSTVLCTGEGLGVTAQAVSSLDDAYLGWWLVTPPTSWSGDCLVEDLPFTEAVLLAIGPLHPEAAALAEGLDAAADGSSETLNGAYLSFDEGETLYVLGVAGLPAAYAAEAGPDVEAPLDDGLWQVLPVYAFAL